MKKVLLGLVCSLFILSMVSCKGKSNQTDQTISDGELTVTPTITEANITEIPNETPTPGLIDSVEFSENGLEDLSAKLTHDLLTENFEEVYSYLEDTVKEQLSLPDLEKAFHSTVERIGELVDAISIKATTTGEYISVDSLVEYTENGLKISYVYNKDCKLVKLWFSYQPIEEEYDREKMEEIDITIGITSGVTVGEGEFPLDGILTMPKGIKNPPVVVLVQGSGQSDMDETIGGTSNKPFRDIARGLASEGIASIRYNKRFYQYMDQASDTMTIYDEVLEDVTYAIQYAKSLTNVNTEKIFVLGHSLGGMLCPKIAEDNSDIAGFISLAGSPRKLEDLLLDQSIEAVENGTVSESEKTLYLDTMKAQYEQIKSLTEENLDEPLLGANGYYWKSLNDIDTPKIVANLTLPMLFMQGEADFQVYPEVDFKMWKDLLQEKDNATFQLYEGLNHLFMPTTGVRDISDYSVKNKVDDKVILAIAAWVKEH
ncbi:alpha/beta hydrolase [Lachnoclostridium phytofermentans]|uniref:PGAP1 family protein n=1 Tax=Lachnoclostridium phytofermentans (strain ATCC 700394 / DSM 18823 / ISDg) TaxID=357809 RepID=A9KL18_LACP7|nr:alpha/beta fold hydrolase [Lachnoclostridium phytofermentans]ABX44167.1 PGAP1 family protein [Lachnoclostridium phytofermentans ISDg]